MNEMDKEHVDIDNLVQSIRKHAGDSDGFTAPPDFFEQFEQKMLNQVREKKNKKIIIPLWKKPAFQIAASIVLIVGLFSIFLFQGNSNPSIPVTASTVNFTLQSDKELEEAYEFLAFQEALIFENINSEELNNITIEQDWFDSNNEIDVYLELHESEFSNILDDEAIY